MTEHERARRTRLLDALNASLEAIQVDDQDQALAALLADYARELDGAAAMEARARKLAEDVIEREGKDSALHERVQALQAALTRRQALDRIGARFHGALVEMLGTPRARAGGKTSGQPAPAGQPGAPAGQDGTPAGALGKLRLASGGDE